MLIEPRSCSWNCPPRPLACQDVGGATCAKAHYATEQMADGVPQATGAPVVEPRMDVRHVADAVVYMADLPLDANVLFLTVMATGMPFIGRG